MLNKIIKSQNKEYPCIDIDINEIKGNARIKITDWRTYQAEGNIVSDVFHVSRMNGNGLGSSSYANTVEEVINKISPCVWVDSEDIKKLEDLLNE